VEQMVGTGEAKGQAFLMYPNPAVDWIKIVLPAGLSGYLVELADASGHLLRSQVCGNGDCVLDLRGLPGGAYFLTVKINGQAVFSSQVIKRM